MSIALTLRFYPKTWETKENQAISDVLTTLARHPTFLSSLQDVP
ncbi:hypothetical protein [Nostoc sp. PA-18-2419]|nr:hypothetical protein [Nostoc sp. PA-18-2419]